MNYDYMIYPKQFRSAKIPIEKNRCFFLMPFNDSFDNIYGTVKDILLKSGYICNRVDEITDSKPIINKIIVEILRAQYIIVDLTGCNANVFYELGISHTFKDSKNVLLIKQQDTIAPFDIKHLQYQEYNPNNLKQLASIIRDFIFKNREFNEFSEALNVHGVISLIYDNQDGFLEYLYATLGKTINTLTSILNYNATEISLKSIDEALDSYSAMIHRVINEQRKDILPGILRLYIELLTCCSSTTVSKAHVSCYLSTFFAMHNLSYDEVYSYQTDLAVALAEKQVMLPIVLPWIIKYFSRSKSTTIDLNRYKLEALLLTTKSEEINHAMINALFSKDCHIREHMADLIGEKRLSAAGIPLCQQLLAESNYYSANSIIEAIGKIDFHEGIEHIFAWLKQHEEDIIQSKMFTVFRHARNAITRLDHTDDRRYKVEISSRYDKYITENVPL